ncbi:MAG: phytoene desaturase, partial [Pseudomonadota bacterium]
MYGERILRRISSHLGEDVGEHVRFKKVLTPDDFAAKFGSYGGALHGYAIHGKWGGLKRPSAEHKKLPGLYFVGGTTHPGQGIPVMMHASASVA